MSNRYLHVKLVDHFEVRPFARPDALGVVDLLYKTYGYTYRGMDGVYDPDVAAERFMRQDGASIVASDVTGRIVGFVAMTPRGPGEAEIDALAVDPELRRANVARRLAEAMFEVASKRNTKVVTSLVTRHPFAQRTVIAVRFLPLALEIGCHPPELAFRGAEERGDPQRESFLYGGWFFEKKRAAVFLPSRHAAAIRELYALHGLERFSCEGGGEALDASCEIDVQLRETWLSARIDVRRPGRDLVERVESVKQDLEKGFIEHLDLRLPLDHPYAATADVARLEGLGFFFSGVDPSVDGHDVLRLTSLARPHDFSRILLEPVAQPLGRYVETCARGKIPRAPKAISAPGSDGPRKQAAPPAEAQAPQGSAVRENGHAVRSLSAGLAHEINNPLNIILGSTYYVKQRLRDGKHGEVDEQLKTIESEVHRIAKLLEGLRRYASPEEAARTPIDLESPIASAMALVEPAAKARSVSLSRRSSSGGGALPPVLGNAPQLEQAVAQVLLNAVDASPVGADVMLEIRKEGGAAVILVRDRGAGIAPEDMPHVFEPFFTKKDPGKGVGLGLAIARSIFEAHGGGIEIESDRSGGGTLARMRLPIGGTAASPAHQTGPEPRVPVSGLPEGAPLARGLG